MILIYKIINQNLSKKLSAFKKVANFVITNKDKLSIGSAFSKLCFEHFSIADKMQGSYWQSSNGNTIDSCAHRTS